MARGNQRENSREANLKKMGNIKAKNTKTGPQQAADKANVAAIMQAKQAAADAKKAEAAAAAGKK